MSVLKGVPVGRTTAVWFMTDRQRAESRAASMIRRWGGRPFPAYATGLHVPAAELLAKGGKLPDGTTIPAEVRDAAVAWLEQRDRGETPVQSATAARREASMQASVRARSYTPVESVIRRGLRS